MNSFDELLDLLNSKRVLSEGDWEEDIIYNFPIFESLDYFVVDFNLDVDSRRWYETSVTVVKVLDRFLGIRHISNVFSEEMGASDCGVYLKFDEMIPVPSITYKKKQDD